MNVENKRVLVVGLARSGIAAAKLLCHHGAIAVLSDTKTKESFGDQLDAFTGERYEYHLGEDPIALLNTVDVVMISPGVPIDAPLIVESTKRGVPVIGELELAYSFLQGQVVAISGTNGKTTTTTLMGKIFENMGRITHVAGNIGYPLSSVSLTAKREDVSVVEVSSFQLETIKTFRPHVGAMLNITEDHLNRHGTMEIYSAMKQRLFENQTADDVAVLNADAPSVCAMAEKCKGRVVYFSRLQTLTNGAYVDNGKVMFAMDGQVQAICDADKILIPGPHNLENALAATAMAMMMNVPAPVIRHTLLTFGGVEHRIETVRVLEGVTYINDSKGTNVDSTLKAVQSMKVPTVLLLGGYDKHTDFSPLCQEIKNTKEIAHVIVLGETAKQIETQLLEAGYEAITQASDLNDAVEKARAKASQGGNVLLSPACASFDMFKDYEQRGEVFKAIVTKLH